LGADPERIYLVGHSSGAHLAAMAVSTRWADYGVPENPVRGAVLVSGMYDLTPLRHTSRSKFVNIDDAVIERLSPIRHIASVTCSLIVGVGSRESPEFMRQAREFAQAVAQAGNLRELAIAETYHHFDILETLGNPHGVLGKRLLSWIKSGC
jgi:arylformamidase